MQDEKDLELEEAVETEEEKIEEEAIEAEEKLEDAAAAEEEKLEIKEAEENSLADDFGMDDFGEFADLENQIEVQKNESKKIVSSAKDANYASGFPNWYLEPPLD